MFSKAARFPPEKPSDIPPPGYYNPKEIDGAPYRKGAFLEKSERRVFDKIPHGPGPSDYQSLQADMKPKGHHPKKASTSTSHNEHALRQQIQDLQAENARLAKEHKHAMQTLEAKVEQAEARIRELVREKGALQTEAAVATKEQRLALERESTARLALDKAEKEARQAQERASKYSALQRRLEELEKLHAESKSKSRKDRGGLEIEVEQLRASLAEKQKELDHLRHQRETDERRSQDLKRAHALAEADNQDLRSKLQLLQSSATTTEALQAERRRLEADLQTLQSRHAKEVAELQAKLHTQESLTIRTKQELREREGEIRKVTAQLCEVEAKSAKVGQELEAEKRDRRNAETRLKDLEKGKAQSNEARIQALQKEVASLRSAETQAKRTIEEERTKAANDRQNLETQLRHVKEVMTTVAEQYGCLANAVHKRHQQSAFDRAAAEATRIKLEGIVAEREGRIRQLAATLRLQEEVTITLFGGLNEYDSLAGSILRHQARSVDRTPAVMTERAQWHDLAIDDSWRDELHSLEARTDDKLQELHVFNDKWMKDGYESLVQKADQAQLKNDALSQRVSEAEAAKTLSDAALAEIQAKLATATESVTTMTAELSELKDRLAKSDDANLRMQTGYRAEIDKLSNQLSSEKAYAAQLALDLAHGKSREAALAADLDNLQDSLATAERYKNEYHALLAEVKVILSRNALAEDESERLSRFNAEILSHQNPMQKILYVDKIRREMADVKQKLIVSTLERDAAEEAKRKLQDELATYKAVDIPLDAKPRSVMTRVARVPFAARSVNTLNKSQARTATDRSPTEHGNIPKGSTVRSENTDDALRIEDLRRS